MAARWICKGNDPTRRNENETHNFDGDVNRGRDVRTEHARIEHSGSAAELDHQDYFYQEGQEDRQIDDGQARQFEQGGEQEGRKGLEDARRGVVQCAGKAITALPCEWAGNWAGPFFVRRA
jgi:hypothetical protein